MIHRVAMFVLLVLQREDGQILLMERKNTSYLNGWLVLPGGKVDEGEDVVAAMAREAKEEVGVTIDPADLRIVHVTQQHTPDAPEKDTVGWFLTATRWDGEPYDAEPHLCGGLVWADPDDLPERLWPQNRRGIESWRRGEPFSTQGWTTAADRDPREARRG
ncbi:NUDIX domain-containing protein [Streptomyces sp. NPDC056401]|uniref:NUDIX hydrolase n=1 Tax=Streptomyces sp. NPDC056401 TaxID=3345809 RepID=UPI0035D98333